MTHYHACIWIDHREARIFSIDAHVADEAVVRNTHDHRHIHRRADHVGLGKEPLDLAFFDEIASHLKSYKALLIVGPGSTRKQFAGYLTETQPQLARRIWGIEPMDHPTTGELVAAARKYFHAADGMHAAE